ncbi:hypothetical protein BCR32DRAFT_288930 [Anaeromyces robustus]|uniref:Uncharacterized protein n=1 Tax=Anaeromyces robustus TaxID=1754192 RepID=A0A1Y1XQH9_9FUNG|nr:hypothetical protein BCR32DRAFT_288930 [Anaeromyces robustus]|eukprot:ORX87993.1 hypothetical protein BCR32DRAFT_288930 [Anaeromyces robustus]
MKEIEKYSIEKIVLVQKLIRGFLARRRLQKYNEYATKIQSIYRGYTTRKSYKIKKDLYNRKKHLDKSLVKHERYLKAKFEEFQKLRKLSNSKYFEYKKESKKNAAIKIQSMWRGYYTRKNIDKIKTIKTISSLYEDKENNDIIDLSYIEGINTQNLVNDKVWLKKKFEDIYNNIQKYKREINKKKYIKEKSSEEKKKELSERIKDAQTIMDSYYENYFHFFQLKKKIYENKNAIDILLLNIDAKKINDLKLLPIVKQKLPSKEIKREHQKSINEIMTPWWRILKNNYDLNQIDFDYINEVISNQ